MCFYYFSSALEISRDLILALISDAGLGEALGKIRGTVNLGHQAKAETVKGSRRVS